MAEAPLVHILWLNSGLGCDGDSVALTGATQPSIEDIVLGTFPGLPRVAVTLADDPAAELYRWHGRFLYLQPDEVEPCEERP